MPCKASILSYQPQAPALHIFLLSQANGTQPLAKKFKYGILPLLVASLARSEYLYYIGKSTLKGNEGDPDKNWLRNALSFTSMAYSNKRRGWDGEHLELHREQPTENLTSHAAVNLQQFRNEHIGVGYQAKHVIRQRSVPDNSVVVHTMKLNSTSNVQVQAKRKHEKIQSNRAEPKPLTRLQTYLKCEKLREFRKELATIEYSI
jgi:hypothetical protein